MGQMRSEPETKKHTTKGAFKNIKYATSSMCGWRLYMEDADIVEAPINKTELSIFAVFDGHGGPNAANYVQKHFVHQLVQNKNFKNGHYEEALTETFLAIDQMMRSPSGQSQLKQIHRKMLEKKNCSPKDTGLQSGCTGNVVLITPQYIYCANAGDSRAVASVKNKVQPLSFDHKPTDQKEQKRIVKAGGEVFNGRVNGSLSLSRAFGDFQFKENTKISPSEQMITVHPEIKKIKNSHVDFIIIGCDGIWEVKSNEEMVEWISKRLKDKKQLDKILEQLLDSLCSKESGGQLGMDNMSSILITF